MINLSSKNKCLPRVSASVKIAAIYFTVGVLWILFSDAALGLLVRDPSVMTKLAIAKGWCYVSITALMLYLLVKRGTAEMSQEIEERKQAERALQDSEANLNRAQEIAHIGSWHLDIARNRLTWSDEVYRLFGKPRGAALSYEDFLDMVYPEDRGYIARAWAAALQGAPYDIEHRILVGGELKWVRERAAVEFNQQGKAVKGIGTVQDITERKRAEEERRQSAERFRAIADYTYDWENWIGVDGKLLWVNPAVERITGYSVDECMAMPDFPLPIVAEPDRETVARELREAVQGSSRNDFEFRVRHKDGRLAWVAVSWQPIYDSRGARLGHRSSIRDIAERKQAEEALHRSNRELRAISNCNQVLLRATDEQSLLKEICRIVCEEAGYHMAWVAYAEHDEAKSVHPVAWSGAEEGYLASLGITWADTERGHGPSGTAIRSGKTCCIQDFATDPRLAPWRESALQHGFRSGIALPLTDEHGNAFGSLSIYSAQPNAITPEEIRLLEELAGDLAFGIVTLRTRAARKQAEEEVRNAAAQWQATFDAVQDLVLLLDKDSRILRANQAAAKFLGLPYDKIVGGHCYDLIHGTSTPPAACPLAQMRQSRRHQEAEVLARKGGPWLSVSVDPVFDPSGELTQVVHVARDITERKKAEEERSVNLHFFESMDRVNRAVQGADDLEQTVNDILDAMLSIFDSDRAFLFYPCDPDAPSFEIAMERTRPECPVRRDVIPTAVDIAKHFRLYLASTGAVTIGPGCDSPLETSRFGEKSKIMMALHPKTVKPWALGMHQCSYPRVWRPDEKRLMEEIGRRMSDVLTSLLAHRDLRESEERHRDILQMAMDGFFRTDMQGRMLEVNKTYCRMSGYSEQELLTMNIADVEAVQTAEMIAANIRRFAEEGPNRFDSIHRRKDGSLFDVEVSAQYLPIAPGQTVVFVRDITERKRAEETVRRTAAYLTETQRLSRTGTFVADNTTKPLYWSEELFRIFGFDPQHGLPTKEQPLQRVHPEDLDKFWQAWERAIQEKVDSDVEYRIVLPDGTIRYAYSVGHPVLDANGELVEIVGTTVDITERKMAEAEINNLKNYLSNIIDSMPSILVGMDDTRIVTQWNRQAEAFTGIPAGEAIGKPIVHLLPDFAPWIITMGTGMDEHRPSSIEKLLIEKKGERRFYDLMLYPLIVDSVQGAVVRVEDVTERTRIQQLMVQTEKMMSVGGLAAGMAHEINNPLGIITQAAQNIERRISPELHANRKISEELGLNLEGIRAYFDKRQISDAIASIRTAASRAAKIVANMLQFSRRTDTTMELTSLARIVDQALELAASDYDLKKNFDFRRVEIGKDYQDMPEVRMVSVEIEQVILNLLRNAAQAMTANPPDRKPRITVRLCREDRYAVLEVEDNGPGMTEDIRRRVFEPFFTTKKPEMGTGLGLSVSYVIVTQNHKGLMEVQSTPGRGTVFKVRLPIGGAKHESAGKSIDCG